MQETTTIEPRFVDTKRGLAVVWAAFGVLFGTGLSVLMGDAVADALVFGAAMGLGFAIGIYLFAKSKE